MRFSDNTALNSSTLASNDIFPLTDTSDGNDKKLSFYDLATWLITVWQFSVSEGQQTIKTALDNRVRRSNPTYELDFTYSTDIQLNLAINNAGWSDVKG